MFSTERLDALRERNKDLLSQLWQQREKVELLSHIRKREREDGAEVWTRTLTDGDRSGSREAPVKPTVRFAGNDTVAELVMPTIRLILLMGLFNQPWWFIVLSLFGAH